MNYKKFVGYKRRKTVSRVLAFMLSAVLLISGIGMSGTSVYAQTNDTVSSGDAGVDGLDQSISSGDALDSVSSGDGNISSDEAEQAMNLFSVSAAENYEDFKEDVLVADFAFGSEITKANVYDAEIGYGFSDIEYNNAAAGWVSSVYYPREISKNAAGASYVTDGNGYLAIGSKVWTETESSGYGVYTYENTSSFDMDLAPADYQVKVTLVNPTDNAYTAYLEAEDVTKFTDIQVSSGANMTLDFTAVLVDGTLNLKFLVNSSATTAEAAKLQTAYISKISVTRLATEQAGSKPTIFLASDSTVQTYEDYYDPQTGWGETLALFFGGDMVEREADNCTYYQSQIYESANVIVENRAIGGRSSKSFIDEGKLDDLLEDIKVGDYLFVQWGHNDATSSRPNRYVSPADFGKWIQYYIDGALQRGAIPVLVTPVARYSYTTKADGSLNTFVGNFESYGNIMRSMASEQNIPLIDLTARSIEVCNNFGIEGSKSLFLYVAAGEYVGNYAGGATDATHLQYYGAYKFAQCVAQGILESTSSQLADLKSRVVMTIPESTPGAITNLVSTSVGASSVSMSWDTNSDSELYYVYRQELTDGKTAADVDFSSAEKYSVSATNKYSDNSCKAGTTYVYAVRGFNEKGLGEFSNKIEVTTKSAGYRFDFNYNNSATMEGWTGVNQNQMYSADAGYGWISAPNNGRNRGNNGNADSSAMADDFCLGAGEFAVDLPNGDYEITVYACDLLSGTSTIKPSYTAEGLSIGSISTKQALASCTGTARVVDGQLNIVVGGTNQYINGVTITELLLAPTGFSYSEMTLDEINGTASFLIGFNPVKEAVSYKIYAKNSSDPEYNVVKSFTVEEYEADDLACRAMMGEIGEEYSYYITCVIADGSESAPSNILNISMIQDGPQAAAPADLTCTSPLETETEVKKSISLKWDAVEGAVKYIVYRSDKAEDDKGFVGFEKVGESKTTSYTDSEGVITNINYYYKVAAMTKTGIGLLSEVCKTPVTGKIVAGGLEEYSDRGLIAINLAGKDGGETNVSVTDSEGNELTKGVYLSWRSYEEDFDAANNLTTTFTVYRDGYPIAEKVKVTNLVDEGGTVNSTYRVVGSNDLELSLENPAVNVWNNKYLELDLYRPADAKLPDGSTTGYSANDMSVGDLDGDGVLELIVKWYPDNAKDNSSSGYTGKTYLDGYDVNFSTGEVKLLWRIDMGVNIRSGAHYTQFQVWDYDSDGKAEIAVKTADGTTTYKSTDGTAAGLVETGYVGACNADTLPENTVSPANDYRNSSGYVLDGPEYFSIFNGEDGTKAADDVDYIPGRGNVSAWGDGYGNRVDRFLSATAYLDGENPYAVFARGYYTRTCLTAYYMKDTDGNGVGDTIDTYWIFDSTVNGTQYEGQGNHGIGVNDVDNDGKDEIVYGALVIDNDGTAKYSTGLGHGDAMHISDWVSWNDGLEIMSVHEDARMTYHVEVRDAETGEILMGYYTGKDTGRGVAADIDPTAESAEWWSIASPTYEGNDEPAWNSTNGEVYSTASTLEKLIKLSNSTPPSNFSIYWDGDLLSEIQDHTFNEGAYVPTGVTIAKWNYETEKMENLLYSQEIWSINGTKGNVGLVADVLGDWREEIIARTSGDASKVRIYSTTIQTDYVVPCLLEDLAYREAIAWQNVGYNQPANTSYLISKGLVTAVLSEGNVTSTSAQIQFTPANDGDLYGHDITAYEIYRADKNGKFVKIDTVAVEDLERIMSSVGDSEEEEEEEEKGPVFVGWETGNVIGQYDFGNKNGTGSGFTLITGGAYSSEVGYGFTSTGSVAYSNVGVSINPADGTTQTALESACADLSRTDNELTFAVDVPAGSYRVDVYAGSGTNNTYYNSNTIHVNGVDLGVVSQSNNVAEILKTTDITLEEDGQIVISALNDGKLAILNAAVITEIKPVYQEPAEDDKTDDPVAEVEMFIYTDADLEYNTEYIYKVAAVVDGKTSHMSRPLTVSTAIEIKEVSDFTLPDLVEGTPLAEEQTVADLLPATVKVIDKDGVEMDVAITWDATSVDINKVGEYAVIGTIKGYSQKIEKVQKVVANEVKGIAPVDDINMIVGTEVTLPATVAVEFTNTTTKDVAVIWDTTNLDINKIGKYNVIGILEGFEHLAVQITVNVKDNYITNVGDVFVEIGLNTEDVAAALPGKLTATYADGSTADVEVEWQVDGVDTSVLGDLEITGVIKDYPAGVKANVTIVYPLVAKFDFGIKESEEAEGWTPVTVNAKSGTKTAETLNVHYTEEKGYGFLNAEAVIEGRSETYTFDGVLPQSVYKDFVLPAGNTFVLDVENGTYQVEVVSGSYYKSNVKSTVEGTAVNPSNAAETYSIGSATVEVADGQLTIEFDSGTVSRVDAVIVRQIALAGDDEPTVDKSALAAYIETLKGEDLAEENYTEESWTAFEAALNSASELLNADAATQEEVDEALNSLVEAREGLVEKDEEDPGTEPTPTPTPAPAPTPKPNTTPSTTPSPTPSAGGTTITAPATSDNNMFELFSVLLIASIGAFLVLVNRRREAK